MANIPLADVNNFLTRSPDSNTMGEVLTDLGSYGVGMEHPIYVYIDKRFLVSTMIKKLISEYFCPYRPTGLS